MIIITINHNSDKITMELHDEGRRKGCRVEVPVKGRMSEYRSFIIELLNMVNPSGVTLQEINEDHHTIVEEW